MQPSFPRRLSRRQLLASTVALVAGAGSLHRTPAAEARDRRAIEVLTHDEVHEAAAFNRGRHLGTRAQGQELLGEGFFESEVIESPFPFTHIGVHWRPGTRGDRGIEFELRTSEDGQTWSAWQHLHVEATPENTPFGEAYASLASAPRHRFVQYRAGLRAGGAVNRVTTTFLNSQDGPSLAASTLAFSKPSVIDFTREEWGCDERLRFDKRGREIWPRMYVPVKKLVIHHTAGRNDYTEAEAAGEVRAIYTYHARTLGWGDIGYNVLIDRFGRSYEGRFSRDWPGGREVFGPDIVAGHAFGHNYGSSGFTLLGEFESGYAVANDTQPNLEPPPAMLSRLVDLLVFRAGERQIDPRGSSHYLLSDGAWNDLLPNISGHQDCNATACPGNLVYQRIAGVRQDVHARLAYQPGPSFQTGQNGSPENPSQSTGELFYSWNDGSANEYKFVLEGWYKSSTSEAITYLTGYTPERSLAWPETWTTDTSRSYSGLANGHYTMHLLRRDGSGTTYQSDRTVLINGASGGGKKPRRPI